MLDDELDLVASSESCELESIVSAGSFASDDYDLLDDDIYSDESAPPASTPGFVDCPVDLKTFALFYFYLKDSCKMSRTHGTELPSQILSHMCSRLPHVCLPTSEYQCEQIIGADRSASVATSVCKACGKFSSAGDASIGPPCGCHRNGAASVTVYYLGVTRFVSRLLIDRDYVAARAAPGARSTQGSWWGGEHCKRLAAKFRVQGINIYDPSVMVLNIGGDGVQLFPFNSTYSADYICCRPYDIPPQQYSRASFSDLIAFIPGPKPGKGTDATIRMLADEFLSLLDPKYCEENIGHNISHVIFVAITADTPFRAKLGKFLGSAAYRADSRSAFHFSNSYWKADKRSKKGMYGCGYCKPAPQKNLEDPNGVQLPPAHANDPRYHLDDSQLRAYYQLQRMPTSEGGMTATAAGVSGITPFLDLSYFDSVDSYLIPVAHNALYDACKTFWSEILPTKLPKSPHDYMLPKRLRAELISNGHRLTKVAPHDIGRHYMCIVESRGRYIMENWLAWVVVYSPLVLLDVLAQHDPHLAKAWASFCTGLSYFLDFTQADYDEAVSLARQRNIYEFSIACEKRLPAHVCTLAMRMIAVHLAPQEKAMGRVPFSTEFWVEHWAQKIKGPTKNMVSSTTVGSYVVNRHLREKKMASERPDLDRLLEDIAGEHGHRRRNLAPADARFRNPLQPKAGKDEGARALFCETFGVDVSEVHLFVTTNVGASGDDDEAVHSTLYGRAVWRRSCHVELTPGVDATPCPLKATRKVAEVICYAKCDVLDSKRYALVELYEEVPASDFTWPAFREGGKAYRAKMTPHECGVPSPWRLISSPRKWVELERILHKVILVEVPHHVDSAGNSLFVMRPTKKRLVTWGVEE